MKEVPKNLNDSASRPFEQPQAAQLAYEKGSSEAQEKRAEPNHAGDDVDYGERRNTALTEDASAKNPERPFEKLSDEELIRRYVAERLEFMRSESEKNKLFSKSMSASRRLVADSMNAETRKGYDLAMAEFSLAENALKRKGAARSKEGEALFDEFIKRPGWPKNYERAQEELGKQLQETSKSDPETTEWAFNGFDSYRLEQLNELFARHEELFKKGGGLRQRARELSERHAKINEISGTVLRELRLASVKAEIGTEQDKQHWQEVVNASKQNLEESDKLHKDHQQYMNDSDEFIEELRILTAEFRSLRSSHTVE